MSPREEQDAIFAQHGGVLARQHRHEVWKFPNGKTFVRSITPSDINGQRNSLLGLKRLLGLLPLGRGQPGERRERKHREKRHARPYKVAAPVELRDLQSELRKVSL